MSAETPPGWNAAPTDPWPFCLPFWPVVLVWRARMALSRGGRLHLEAMGNLCSACSGPLDPNCEPMTFIDQRTNDVWPLMVCNECRMRARADWNVITKLESRLGRRAIEMPDAVGRA